MKTEEYCELMSCVLRPKGIIIGREGVEEKRINCEGKALEAREYYNYFKKKQTN